MSQAAQTIPRELVRAPNMARLLRYALQEWLMIALCMLAMVKLPVWSYPLWVLIMGGRLHALGVILHDLSHQSLRKKTASMRLLEVICGWPLGTSANAMAYHHNRHHRHVNTQLDPYFRISKRCSRPVRMLKAMLNGGMFSYFWIVRSFVAPLALLVPRLRTFYGRIFLQDVSKQDLTHHPELRRCLKEDLGVMVFHLAMILLTFKLPILIYLYYIPLVVGGIFCIHRLLSEHEYDLQHDTHFETVMATSFDHSLNWWDHFFFAPRNIGYHAAHHLHPTASIECLPAIREWYLAHYPEVYH